MGKTNYHIHTNYCDGQSSIEEMACAAFDAGLTSIGISSHFTAIFADDVGIDEERIDDYLAEIDRTAEKFRPLGLDIIKGFEADYWVLFHDVSDLFKQVRPKLDYMIGSIHYLDWLDDGTMGVIDWHEEKFEETILELCGTKEDFIERYYQEVGEMAEHVRPDIIGHIDLIKKSNLVLNRQILDLESPFALDCAFGALDRIRDSGSILELNTGGISRNHRPEFLYPSLPILKRAVELKIPLQVNGDSHFPAGINTYYDECDELLRSLGVKEVMAWQNGAFAPVPL